MASGDPDIDQLLADFARWMGEVRTADAARSRSRQRWLQQQAVEEATFAGTALDLAERGEPVVVRTTGDRSHHGRVVAVATDFLVLAARPRLTLIALDAIATLSLSTGAHQQPTEPMDSRPAAVNVSLAATLAGLAGDRTPVQLWISGVGEPLSGELRAVGDDVLTLRQATDPPQHTYVRVASVTECSVFGSG